MTPEDYSVLLNPEELLDLWRYIKPMILAGLPPGTEPTEELASTLQRALLKGIMWCWVIMSNGAPLGAVTACITQDICSEVRQISVYSAWFIETPKSETIREMYSNLLAKGRSQGCKKMSGFTANKEVFDVLKKLKGIKTMIYLEVDICQE